MIKSRFRCYEIESCYIALAMARAPLPPPRRPWWRVLWEAWRAGKAFARRHGRTGTAALLIVLALSVPAQAGELVGSTPYGEWLQLPSEVRISNLSGAMAALTVSGLVCPAPVKVGQVAAAMVAAEPRLSESYSWIAVAIVILKNDYGCRFDRDRLKKFLEVMSGP